MSTVIEVDLDTLPPLQRAVDTAGAALDDVVRLVNALAELPWYEAGPFRVAVGPLRDLLNDVLNPTLLAGAAFDLHELATEVTRRIGQFIDSQSGEFAEDILGVSMTIAGLVGLLVPGGSAGDLFGDGLDQAGGFLSEFGEKIPWLAPFVTSAPELSLIGKLSKFEFTLHKEATFAKAWAAVKADLDESGRFIRSGGKLLEDGEKLSPVARVAKWMPAVGAVFSVAQLGEDFANHASGVDKGLDAAQAAGGVMMLCPPPVDVAGLAVVGVATVGQVGRAVFDNRQEIGHEVETIGHDAGAVGHAAEHEIGQVGSRLKAGISGLL